MLNISKVESLIKEKGWSKTYFCKKFDHSRTWIDDWKRDRGVPDGNVLAQIADVLETTSEYLTDETEQKNKPTVPLNDELSEEIIELFNQLSRDKKMELLEYARYKVGNQPK